MKFRNDINFLRALAVILVVLFHFNVPGFGAGFIGVDIFFVISGYLMTSIIVSGHDNNSFSFLKFYISRTQRIVPALIILCIVLLLLGWFILLPSEYKSLSKQSIASLSFISNFYYFFEAGYFDSSSHEKLLLHTWSLSVEWQFYLIYPILISLIYKCLGRPYIRYILTLLIIISFSSAVYASSHSPSASFYLLFSRFWELAFGGVLFFFKSNKKIKCYLEYFGLTLIISALYFISIGTNWPSWLTIIPILGTGLIILPAQGSSVIMSNYLIQIIGKSSYSIYLWHWPTVVILHRLELLDNNYFIISGIIISSFLGALSYRLIEIPSLSLFRNKITPLSKKLGNGYLFTILIIIVSCNIYIYISEGIPQRVSDEVNIADRERHNSITNQTNDIVKAKESALKSNTILIGDSFASAISEAFKHSVPKDLESTLIIRRGCPTVYNAEQKDQLLTQKCSTFTNTFIDLLTEPSTNNGKTIVIVNSYGYWTNKRIYFVNQGNAIPTPSTENLFIKNFVETSCRLQEKHKVYIVLPIPKYSKNVPTELASKLMLFKWNKDLYQDKEHYKLENKLANHAAHVARETCGIKLLDPTEYLCEDNKCFSSYKGRPLYYDDAHLSRYGASFLEPMFNSIFN